MKSKLLKGLLATGLAAAMGYALFPLQTQAEKKESALPKGPAWFEHIRKIKGVPPQGLYQSWARSTVAYKNNPILLDSMIEIGPFNIGGRTRALLIDVANKDHFIAGGISGGIWNSEDRGRSWTKINDHEINLNVSCITQNPFDPSTIYYGTGEGAGNSSGAPGAGIFKSTDGGKTYQLLPASAIPAFEYCWSIKHSLVDPNTIYIGTQNAGLYRSTDAGQTFEKVFNTPRPIHDVEVMTDSTLLIAVQGLGVYWSKTGENNSFSAFTNGLPTVVSSFGRVEIAYCNMNPDVMYLAYCEPGNEELKGVYKTEDHGDTWAVTPINPETAGVTFPFPWYCLTMNVKHDNPDWVMIGSTKVGYTKDGGKTWKLAQNTHADYHAMVVHPDLEDQIYVGNDGGIWEYNWADLTKNAVSLNQGYNITQFYAGGFGPEDVTVCTGAQDNGTNFSLNGNQNFSKLYGADGSHCHLHQQNPNIAYLSWQNAGLRKSDNYKKSSPVTYSIVNDLDGDNDGEIDDGSWFIHPYEMNYLDGEQLYFAAKRKVFRSLSGGEIWEPISNRITPDAYVVGISNQKNPTLYVGGNLGSFFRINNAAIAVPGQEKNLRLLSPTSIRSSFIGAIKVSPLNPGTVYIGLTDYSTNPRIWKITEANKDTPAWHDISGDLPKNLPVNWIEVDPASPDSIIFAGTDFGLFYTDNGGTNWYKDPTVPNVTVHMIRIRHSDRRIFIFTHGRGVFSAVLMPYGKEIPGHDQIGMEEKDPIRFSLYPNPGNDYIQVESLENGPIKATIFDLKGTVLKEEEVVTGNSIDIRALKKGMLIVRLEQNGKASVQKILKLN